MNQAQRSLPSMVALSHLLLARALRAGGCAVDATAGNGLDTVHLAQCVGPTGRVYAFDVQAQAMAAVRARLPAGWEARVALIHAGHETLAQHVDSAVDAAIFNLGWLPHGDKSCVTQAHTTRDALQQCWRLLVPGGLVVLVVYTGHPGAQAEQAAVEDWVGALPAQEARVMRCHMQRGAASAPYLLAVEKRS